MRTGRSAAILALAAGLAVTLLGCSSGAPTGAPATAALAAVATNAATATAGVISPASTPGSTPAATQSGPIADGTYASKPIAVSDAIARIKADKTLSTTQRNAYLQEFNGLTTDIVEIDLHAGQWTESDAFDGGVRQVGARATFAFPDSHTLVIQEVCCGLSTWTISPAPNGFSLRYKAGAPNTGEDVVGQWLFESSPFTLVP